MTEWRALTNWGPQKVGQIKTQKESDQVRGTHFLETTEGEISQNMEGK